MPASASSSEVRSCISFWAFWGSFQRLGSSASLFSSARRAVDASTSKMPPQQPDRLLDLFNEAFDFGAHDGLGCNDCEGCNGRRVKAQSAEARFRVWR
jgi:hypothetical protein